jgi:uncharacterized protein
MTHLPGKFVWFEHLSSHAAKARTFYESLFGWATQSMPMGARAYPMIMCGGHGIGGYGAVSPNAPARWMSYLSVPDVDAAYQAALGVGAKSIVAPMSFGSVGRGATITDPFGATFSLWKSAQGDREDVNPTPVGEWVWNELWTADPLQAVRFYESAFGFSHEAVEMGEHGTYYLLKKNGVNRGGVSRAVDSRATSMWLPYVEVADCDGTAAAAARLGGRTLSAAADIPGVGRFAILADATGAPIAVLQSSPNAS